jgi:hypothetical protein
MSVATSLSCTKRLWPPGTDFIMWRSILSFSRIARPLSMRIGGWVASKFVLKSGGGCWELNGASWEVMTRFSTALAAVNYAPIWSNSCHSEKSSFDWQFSHLIVSYYWKSVNQILNDSPLSFNLLLMKNSHNLLTFCISTVVTFRLIVFNSASKYKSMKYSWQNRQAPFRRPSIVDAWKMWIEVRHMHPSMLFLVDFAAICFRSFL